MKVQYPETSHRNPVFNKYSVHSHRMLRCTVCAVFFWVFL